MSFRTRLVLTSTPRAYDRHRLATVAPALGLALEPRQEHTERPRERQRLPRRRARIEMPRQQNKSFSRVEVYVGLPHLVRRAHWTDELPALLWRSAPLQDACM